MSDDTKSPHEETHGLNRRGFLGASALIWQEASR